MKVAVFETDQWENAASRRLEPRHQVLCTTETLTERNADEYADADVVSPFVYSSLTAPVLARLPYLRLIATRSTGYDHIDMAYCHAHDITVCTVPNYGDSTVAEHVFALLLATARHLVDAVENARRGRFGQAGLRGFELRGKTLGVIGTGRIGRRVIEIASGFTMSVVATDTVPDPDAARRLGFRYVDLAELLAVSDIVTVHVPAAAAVPVLGEREFGLMKPGVVVVNTARGSVIDETALVRALADGTVRAACLDVLAEEPLIREEAEIFRRDKPVTDLTGLTADHILLRSPNVLVTPHNAYNTDEALRRIIETTLDNIDAFARGAPRNIVTGDAPRN